ncbi:DUF3515 domain-containing protein [Streptomyces beihaiensis]|uniref:DUF3515 domain-containing protein n=1 Tax=Streptomyces beihaiensis TaxID=2984495 RepID=A0ABT3TUU8_9ACTN|nr:DUF3515 domain-containing protein [Streptomyces beihaiensis]MCX3060814.1 DUF3515 domain-containing protein [Streptomyces beihaiensis]
MNLFRHRHFGLPALSVLSLLPLLIVTGCSSTDGAPTAAVPSPDAKVTKMCRKLHDLLPQKVEGHGRNDPEPHSELTAAWGSPAIILRCGVAWPSAMADKDTLPATVNGVGWGVEKLDDGAQRMYTALRQAYVEVTIPKELVARDGAAPLVDLAGPIKKAIPKGIAD